MRADPPLYSEESTARDSRELSVVRNPEILPFVGRQQELDYVTAFARGALAADRLSALWLQGEAGIGKSRMIDRIGVDLFPAVIVIRVILYPDSNFSVQSALASAVIEAGHIYGISTHLTLPSTLPATLAELRGIIRRYPTLLVFEDVHLIDEGTVTEFAAILHGLEREAVGLICTSRPNSGSAYGLVLPFLVTTLWLPPFDIESLHELARHFGYDPERYPNLIHLLMERTHGSPLAIWSIFRRLQSDPEEFSRHPLRTVREISSELSTSVLRSMAHGLTQEELRGAESLAILGELFSSRGAAVLLEDAPDLLTTLQQAGIIFPQSGSPSPLVGTVSVDPPNQDWLYRFSHSLLHEALVDNAPDASPSLLALLESDIPLYSTLPFTHAVGAADWMEERDSLNRLLHRYRRVIRELAISPAWSAGVRMFRAIERVLDQYRSVLSPEEYRRHRIEMLLLECTLYNTFSTRSEFQRPLAEVLEMTGNPGNLEESVWRIRTLQFALFRDKASWQSRGREVLIEARSLLEKFPELLRHEETRSLFADLASTTQLSLEEGGIGYVRDVIEQMLQDARERGDHRGERSILRNVAPRVIPFFRTAEEIEDRRELAQEIISSFRGEKPSGPILSTWVRFLEVTGHADQAQAALQQWMPPVLSGYNVGTEVGLRIQKLNVDAALGLPLEQIARRARGLINEFEYIQPPAKGDNTPSFAQVAVATHLITIGAMRGAVQRGYETALEICRGEEGPIREYRELDRAVLVGDLDRLQAMALEGKSSELFQAVLDWYRAPSKEFEKRARQQIRDVLTTPPLRRHDLLRMRTAVGLFDLLGGSWGGMTDAEREDVRTGFRNGLTWLGERYAPGYAEPFAHSAQEYLETAEIARLLGDRYAALPRTPEEGTSRTNDASALPLTLLRGTSQGSSRLRIALFGKITMQTDGEKEKNVRGTRMKRFIAMLGVQEMLGMELTLHQFRESATEIEDPEESANYLRILTSRLRKSIGNEMILTDGEHPPRLNRELVRLDVVDLTEMIRSALQAVEQNNGAAAYTILREVIERVSGRELLPDQEGELFEAARNEFRDQLRDAVNRTADLLRREGSSEKGEELSAALRTNSNFK